ncbi:hypothetical protein EX30DRAFT_306050, partial [Ascodesmis nigricans]
PINHYGGPRNHQNSACGEMGQSARSKGPKIQSPKFKYQLFNCNHFIICYWSWNYRGCRH